MLAKLCWEYNARERELAGNDLPKNNVEWRDPATGDKDYRLLKATELPFNKRITVPQPMDNVTEVCMQNLKVKLNQCTKRYTDTQRSVKGCNLSEEQRKGLMSLKEKKEEKEIVIFETDKSRRFACDTLDNYIQLGQPHIQNDDDTDTGTIQTYEKLLNAHSGMWTRMLRAGEKTQSDERIRHSMMSKNNTAAPLSLLRKDHKQYESEMIGPPGRPVCGGDVSYNRRISHLISTLLTDLYIHEKTVCMSTEGLLAEVERINNEGIEAGYIIGSADVEALYPSLDVAFTVEKVCEVFMNSTMNIKGINYKELTLYLSLNKTDAQLQNIGVHEFCPKRRSNRGPRPCITGCGMEENEVERYRPWVFPDIEGLDEGTERRLLTEALRIVLITIMGTHTYEFAGSLKRQKEGGPIGMELTGVVAQVFMVWWDRELKQRLDRIDFRMLMHQRYVDDTNVAPRETEVGARYDGERLTVNESTVAEDEGIPPDERTMKVLQKVASYIHPSIRLTIDYPSKHADRKVPMLDVKMWMGEVNQQRKILYEHYEKETATKAVIHAKSALSMQTKRTVLTQEVLRILLHCSRYLEWEIVCTHINAFMKKMQFSGYSQSFRYNVVNSALNGMKLIREKDTLGIRPIYRPKEWMRVEREREKVEKKRSWYRSGGFDSVLFVPATPEGRLKKMYQSEILQSGLRIKVVERTGATLKSLLQTSNPFKNRHCGREDCYICTSGGTGDCRSEGVTYEIKCVDDCDRKNIYKGESAGNGYTRGKKHKTDLVGRSVSNSPLWRHCRDIHNGVMQDFRMNVTGVFRDDAMLRQITEAVQIDNVNPLELMNTRAEWNMTRVPRATIS